MAIWNPEDYACRKANGICTVPKCENQASDTCLLCEEHRARYNRNDKSRRSKWGRRRKNHQRALVQSWRDRCVEAGRCAQCGQFGLETATLCSRCAAKQRIPGANGRRTPRMYREGEVRAEISRFALGRNEVVDYGEK